MLRAQRALVRLAICLGAVTLVLAAQVAQAQLMKKLDLGQMVDKSDNIFTATCTKKEVVWQNGAIVTKYKMKVGENWKGTVPVDKNGEIEMEELGGVLPNSPGGFTQYLPTMSNFDTQEEVLLFAHKQKFNPKTNGLNKTEAPRLSPDTLRVTGGNQGRFTVIRHPESGKRLVSRVGVEPYPGSVKTPLFKKLQAIEAEKKAAAERIKAGQKQTDLDKAAEARRVTAKVDELSAEARAKTAGLDTTNDVVAFETLDSVKAKVSEKMNKSGK